MSSGPHNVNPKGAGSRDRFELASTHDEIERIEHVLMQKLADAGYDQSAVFAIRLAFQEAMNNARIHGNAMNPDRRITLDLDVKPSRVEIEVEDEGAGFDPTAVPDPTLEENIEIPSGRGLALIRAFMSQVDVIPPGNRLRMIYAKQ